MIIGTEIGLVGQKGKANLNIFMTFSFSEHHGESGMGEQWAGSTIQDWYQSAGKPSQVWVHIVNSPLKYDFFKAHNHYPVELISITGLQAMMRASVVRSQTPWE